jgi:integrase
VLPVLGEREFTSIRRSDVATLMDEIEDDHGARQADLVLGIVRSIMNWYATRDDDYRPPLVKGMRRIAPKDLERSRVLDDRELAAVWKVAEDNGTFGALILLLLLSGQRLRKVMAMRWQDITVDGVWTIQTEKDKKGKTREKSNAEELLLPEMALQIIRAQPRLGDNPYVLAGRGNSHTNNLSDGKKAFDKKLAEVLPNVERWVLHDLRRTARSLMSRADVRREHAERVLGHAIGGVEGTYDHHKYTAEKADALRKLAALIDSIVHPRPATVLPMKGRKKQNAGAAG